MQKIDDIAIKLRRLRERHNFTQDFVAQQIKVSRRWYGKIENGEAEPKEENLQQIANLYKVTIDDIKNFDEKKIFTNNISGGTFEQFYNGTNYIQAEQTIASQKQTISTLQENVKVLNELLAVYRKNSKSFKVQDK